MPALTFALTTAALVFVAGATVLAALLSTVDGALSLPIVWVSLVVAVAPGVLAFRKAQLIGVAPPAGKGDLLALAAFAVVAVRHFLWIVFERSQVLCTPDPYNYGDLPLHWTYIRYLAGGALFWPENPIFTGARLQYPFGIDLFTALLVKVGVPMSGALRLVGLAGSAALCVALFRWGRGFAVAAFLCSGGLAGADAAWKNLFLALFVPQRGFLFALPAGLLLLWSWRERLLGGRRGLPAWTEGVLWGAMPLFHLHTFLFVSVMAVVWTLCSRRVGGVAQALAWALVPGTWTVFEVTNGFQAASLVWWKPGWVIGPESPLAFLLANFTLFLPLFAWAGWLAFRARDPEGRATILPGLALFASLFFVMLAPWDWDNTKIMVWCYLLMLPAAERLVMGRLGLALRIVVLVGLLAPGAVAIGRSLGPAHAYEVIGVGEEASACRGLEGLPVGARVATVQTFNHPVALCGHPLVAGYSGHLWSHGIRAQEVEEGLRSLMMGETGWEERARALRARYVFWGEREERAFPSSTRPWELTRRPVRQGSWGRLYDLGP